jgi:ATP-dependent Lon protease
MKKYNLRGYDKKRGKQNPPPSPPPNENEDEIYETCSEEDDESEESEEVPPPQKTSKKHAKEVKETKETTTKHTTKTKKTEKAEKTESENEEEKNINIVFTIGGGGAADYDEDEDELSSDDDDEEEEEEEEPTSEDVERIFMKEYHIDTPSPILPEKTEEKDASTENEYLELVDLKKHLSERLVSKPNSKILLNTLEECKESIKDLIYDARKKNTKEYYKLINRDRERPSELNYFKTKMSNKEQLKIMEDLKEINQTIFFEKPYRLILLESNMPSKFKAIALQKLNILKTMEPGDPEYYKIKNWIDTFMKIPFCQYKNLTLSIKDGLENCHLFMKQSKSVLDDCVYGLNDAKLQIMQMVGQWIVNPDAIGSAISIQGPPGTGKTSLVKDGISKILGREFAFIALGGTGDSSFLEGHSYTYEGSSWGKIVQILIDSKCMNPVIYFDELDKVSDTPRGQEIIGILTHLIDTTQNEEFHDKYFSEITFDLSKCLFIFSYNDETKINSILKDRMYCIRTKGYNTKEKIIIANKYILPKIREQVKFDEKDIVLSDSILEYIITHPLLTKGEEGVRNLKRCLEVIFTKLNLFRLMKPEDNFFLGDMDLETTVSFPFVVEKKHVDILIKNDRNQNQSLLSMYV